MARAHLPTKPPPLIKQCWICNQTQVFVPAHMGLCEKLYQYKQLPRTSEPGVTVVRLPLEPRHSCSPSSAICVRFSPLNESKLGAAALSANGGTTRGLTALTWGECRRSVFLATDGSESRFRLPTEEPPLSDESPSLVKNRTFVLLHHGSVSPLVFFFSPNSPADTCGGLVVVCMTSFTSMLGVTSYVRLLNCYTGLRPVHLLVVRDVRTLVWVCGVAQKKNLFFLFVFFIALFVCFSCRRTSCPSETN